MEASNDLDADAHVRSWPTATLLQEFMSAMPPKADKAEPT
jgi:hypothetical protein